MTLGKKIGLAILAFLLLIVLFIVFILGYLGYVPGLSAWLGATKPKDLGVVYTPADLQSAIKKGKIEYDYESVSKAASPAESVIYSGSNKVDTTLSSAEMTAWMNNQNYAHWPYRNVQFKLNGDGSAEISGQLVKSRVAGYAAAIDFPSEVVSRAMGFLPPDPVFYVKIKASAKNNRIETFEPQSLMVGRLSLPVGIFLSALPMPGLETAYADTLSDIEAELEQVDNKRDWIINYINRRAAWTKGFFAEEMRIEENKLVFKGTLPDQVKMAPAE